MQPPEQSQHHGDDGVGIRSTVHIIGHPVHPMLVLFPVSFLVGAAATDIAFLFTSDEFWARGSLWLIAAGSFSGLLAALVGLIDFLTIKKVRSHRSGWIHFLGNVAVLVIAFANWIPRIEDPGSFIAPSGLLLSVITAVLLGITGWTGGELSYRHGIGVTGH